MRHLSASTLSVLLLGCAVGPSGSSHDRQESRPRPAGQESGACGMVDYVGTCVEGDSRETLLFCDGGTLHEVYCENLGGTCGLVDGLNDCILPDPMDCDLPVEGVCDADNNLSYCTTMGTQTVFCGEGPELGCGFDAAYGRNRCLQTCEGYDPPLTEAGSCVGDHLLWCDGGILRWQECDLAGLTCGQQNGYANCIDAGTADSCESNQFACGGDPNVCIWQGYVCDGSPQCMDGSDEASCGGMGGGGCEMGEIECPEDPMTCIPVSWICDTIPDCPMSSDEADCGMMGGGGGGMCGAAEFSCDTGECIPADYRCDCEYVDCADGSDEAFCDCPMP